ncbi:hypothetical protein N7491_004177 [Penicillium cf. griseofulvum]|nr:hypothetical protein N7491_004177 [Penicillium cf. griseofulvum]
MASLGLEYLESDSSDDPDRVPESPPPVPSTNPGTEPGPVTQFRTREEGIAAINEFARPHGYAVTSRRSKTTKKGVVKTIRLICDRGRVPAEVTEEPLAKRRNTNTLATGCPFRIALRLNLTTDHWHLTIENPTHNHLPSPASTHTTQRAIELTHKKDKVENAIRQGRTTRQILTKLREADPESTIIAQDIYNTRKKLNQIFLAGRTPIQALLQELPKDSDWIFKYEIDDQFHISALFYIHKSSVKILQMNLWVISIDCTYKTNQYSLPLLDIVGFAATGSTFHAGFAFMRDEKEDTYEVILSCLTEVYESLSLDPLTRVRFSPTKNKH